MGLAPTASSTGALAIGDALATVVCKMRGFTKQNFALSHPGGGARTAVDQEYMEQISK